MSQYIEFYMKVKDTYVPLAIYCRSSELYQAFNEVCSVPYEKAVPFHSNDFAEVKAYAKKRIADFKEMPYDYDERIAIVKSMEGDFDERLEKIEELLSYKAQCVAEVAEIVDELNFVVSFCDTILNIFSENSGSYSDHIVDVEDLIYVGIECGNPGKNYDED